MSTGNQFVEIRFSNGEITPSEFQLSDLAEVLNAVQDMIAAELVRNGDANSTQEVKLGLVGVIEGSAGFRISGARHMAAVLYVWNHIATALADGDSHDLTQKSVDGVKVLQKTSRKYNCVAEFRRARRSKPIYTLKPETNIELKPALVIGRTTLYGRVISVGGQSTPSIHIQTAQGKVPCYTTEETAIEAARFLYQTIGLEGEARWRPDTLELTRFKVDRILPYRDTPLTEALAALSDVASQYYADVDDPAEYVSEIRGAFDVNQDEDVR